MEGPDDAADLDVGQLDAHLRRIVADVLGEAVPAGAWSAPPQVYKQFAADPAPAAIFVTRAADHGGEPPHAEPGAAVVPHVVSNALAPPPFSSVVAVMKAAGPLSYEEPLALQLFPVALPTGDNLSAAESLRTVLRTVVGPYFEASAGFAAAGGVGATPRTTSANITTTRQKIAELERSFVNLARHAEIAPPELEINSAVNSSDLAVSDDVLNSLERTVNQWKRAVWAMTSGVAERPLPVSASAELAYWASLQAALQNVQAQIESAPVQRTLDILKQSKRFHTAASFSSDTGLAETLDTVRGYQTLLQDLPLSTIQTAPDLGSLNRGVDAVFAHIAKRFRPSTYPVERAVALVECISADLTDTIREIFQRADLPRRSLAEFEFLVSELSELFERWDHRVRDFTNLGRELIRKRGEKFIPVRVAARHTDLQERLNSALNFRRQHDRLLEVITNVVEGDAELARLHSLQNIEATYAAVAVLDVLDVSPSTARELEVNERIYVDSASALEIGIGRILRTRLANARTANQMFRVLDRFNPLFDRPAIRGAIQEYQTRLIETVKDAIIILQKRLDEHFVSSPSFELAKLQDVPAVSGLVIWLNQVRDRLNELTSRVESILGPDWQHYAEGRQLQTLSEQLRAKIDTKVVLNEWFSSATRRLPNIDEPVFTAKRGVLSVNFDRRAFMLFKEVKILSSLGITVPHTVVGLADESRSIYPTAVRIIESLTTLYAIEAQVAIEDRAAVRPLLQRSFNSIYALIDEGLKLTWSQFIDGSETPAVFVSTMEDAIGTLEQRARSLFEVESQVSNALASLGSEEYSRESSQIAMSIIRDNVQVLDRGFSNVTAYTMNIDVQVNEILSRRCLEELSRWMENLTTGQDKLQHHYLMLSNKSIVAEPGFEHSRAILHAELVEILRQVSIQSVANGSGTLALSDAVTAKIASCMDTITKVLAESYRYLAKWRGFQGLWDLKVDDVHAKLGNDLNLWNQILVDVEQDRKTLESDRPSHTFGRIVIDFRNVRSQINAKYDAWQDRLFDRFGDTMKSCSLTFSVELTRVSQQLEQMSFVNQTVEALLANVAGLTTWSMASADWASTVKQLRLGQAALTRYRFKFPKDWVYYEHLLGQTESVNVLMKRRTAEFEQHRSRLVEEVEQQAQRLLHQTAALISSWQSSKPVSGSLRPDDAIFALQKFDSTARTNIRMRDMIRSAASRLDLTVHLPDELDDVAKEVSDFISVWRSVEISSRALDELGQQRWLEVVPRKLRSSLNDLMDQTKQVPARTRQYVAFQHVQSLIRSKADLMATLTALRSPSLRQRHWDALFALARGDAAGSSPVLEALTLNEVWSLNLITHKAAVNEQIETAEGEQRLESYLEKMMDFWNEFTLEFVPYNDRVRLIRNWGDIFEHVDDNLQALATMHHSPHFRIFEKVTLEWEAKLSRLRSLFDDWVDVQRQWTYLEGIFTGVSIRSILANETTKFGSINSELLAIFRLAYKHPKILETAGLQGLESSLKRLAEQLAKLQKALGDYYERERTKFPRLYFVGDHDLLEMLGNSSIASVEKHLGKLFIGMATFVGGSSSRSGYEARGVRSSEDEELIFLTPASAPSLFEFLQQVELKSRMTLKALVRDALSTLEIAWRTPPDFVSWLERPNQAALLALRVSWTRLLDDASNNVGAVQQYAAILSEIALHAQGDLRPLARRRAESVITELVYQKGALENSSTGYDVERRLRYYWDNDSQVLTVKQAGASFVYGFEYQGAPSPLVVTPLIEDLYLTMTQALDQKLGGSPFGPAGTGKTEGVKALGQALGKSVVVFNCDESFDFQAITRLLMGILQTGSWACFDEFNRLEDQILSSVSMQISAIEGALRSGDDVVELSGRRGQLDPQTAVFVTMNPRYAGRNALPDNMLDLFRSFAMNSPDREQIVEVVLYSQGFALAPDLSTQLVSFFASLSSNLSQQQHYDWSLRALKSVLRTCGSLKRSASEENEHALVKRACNDTILPKLVRDDLHKYESAEETYFAVPTYVSSDDRELVDTVKKLASEGYLVAENAWLNKFLQLRNFVSLHHGIMLVGETATGKSTVYKMLAQASQPEVELHWIDAKSLTKSALFGTLDPTTREWSDGVFTAILRRIGENLRGESRRSHWIVFDGDIDPVWAENLNSVLDDNKVLTLSSGERIPLLPNTRILFEVSSLDATTPATVSRCGMIWFDQNIVTPKMLASSLLSRYLRTLPEETISNTYLETVALTGPLLSHLDLDVITQHAASLTHIMEFGAHRSLTTLFAYLEAAALRATPQSDDFMNRKVILGLIWAFAGDCSEPQRSEFAQWLLTSYPRLRALVPENVDVMHSDVSLISGSWVPWNDQVPRVDIEANEILRSDLVIPTEDTVKHESLLHSLLSAHQPLILCGPPGSGKTMTLLNSLRKSDDVDLVALNLSKSATPELIIRTLEQRCKYTRTSGAITLEPTEIGRWLVLFCDEINLPSADKYGSQPVISFLRGMLEQGGFWQKGQWVNLSRIQLVGACNPPTDIGRLPMSPRFLRHCSVVLVGHTSPRSLHLIYERMVNGVLRSFPDLRGNSDLLASAMIDVYQHSLEHLGERLSHYVYSPRELSRWCRGIHEAVRDQYDITMTGLVRIWAHEALRLFSDRLKNVEERKWTWNIISEAAEKHFPQAVLSEALKLPILYSSWLAKSYTEVEQKSLKSFLLARLDVFSEEVIDTSLTLFDDLLDHTLRIDRVLRQAQGHLILMGDSSSGKTTLTKFVCWMNGISVEQLRTANNYSDADFAADLRGVLKRAGADGEKLCFILDESNLKDSSFIERMNTLLANSEVPGLFENEEYSALLAACKEGSSSQGLNLSDEDDLIRWFTSQITANLHVVFTLNSPDSDVASRAVASPALINRCVLNWMGSWSSRAMRQYADEHLATVDLGDYAHETVTDAILSVHEHATIEAGKGTCTAAVTPGELVSCFRQFRRLYNTKREELEDEQRHLHMGSTKLKATVLEIEQLRTSLGAKRAELTQKDAEGRAMLQKMLTDQSEAERKREASVSIQYALEQQNAEISARREVAARDLESAEPAVIEAQRGVSNIKKQHLTELRTFANPPEAVKITLEAVCVLLGQKHSTWREVQQSVRGDEFIPSIVHFDNERQMTPAMIHLIQSKYMVLPNFNYEAVNRASKASGPLLQWVIAQVTYATVLAKVEPLRQEVVELEHSAREKTAQHLAIKEMIGELEESIENYKSGYAQLIAETQAIKSEMEQVERKVERSKRLMESLQSERKRWAAAAKDYAARNAVLLGDALVAGIFLAYGGPFDQRVRRSLLSALYETLHQAGIQYTEDLQLEGYLSTEKERVAWQQQDLPSDAISLANQSMLRNFDGFPLIIDPAGQAKEFLLKVHGPTLVVTTFLDTSFVRHLERAVRFGTPILIEHAESLDPVVMSILNREYRRKGGRVLVNIGRQEVDVSRDFVVYMTTEDPQVRLPPHVSSRTTVVNFAVTRNSLEVIALEATLVARRPELETQRQELLKLQGEYRVRLHNLEEELLNALSGTQTEILEDQALMEMLERTKREAELTAERASEVASAMTQVSKVLTEFEPIADLAGRIFDLINALRSLNAAYEFSLPFFLEMLQTQIVQGAAVADVLRGLYLGCYTRVAPALIETDRHVLLAALLALHEDGKVEGKPLVSDLYATAAARLGTQLRAAPSDEELSQVVAETPAARPLLLGMAGADPTLRVQALAMSQGRSVRIVALGSVEAQRDAQAALEWAARGGHWVLVQNIHLAPRWMDTLSQQVRLLLPAAQTATRVFLTSRLGAPAVPITLVRQCRLVAVERPAGLRASIAETLAVYGSAFTDPPAERARVLLSAAWLHGVAQERVRLGSVGWRGQGYGFGDADVKSVVHVVHRALETSSARSNVDPAALPWAALQGLVATTIYGAKMDDNDDKAAINALVQHVLSPDAFNLDFALAAAVPETRAPETTNLAAVHAWLAALPAQTPRWLGLEAGAAASEQEMAAAEVQSRLASLMTEIGSS